MIYISRGITIPEKYSPVLNENTWEQIRKASDNGVAQDLWKVGDTKKVVLNGTVGGTTFSSLAIDATIIGINHNSFLEGQNTIHFQIGEISNKNVALIPYNYNQSGDGFVINTSYSKFGGWKDSYMRNNVLKSFLNVLPSDLKTYIKPCKKYTDNFGGGSYNPSDITQTEDVLFLPSEFEVAGTQTYSNPYEKDKQKQYEYFKTKKVKYSHQQLSKSISYWTRSAFYVDIGFCYINKSGDSDFISPQKSFGLSPCFCI